MARTACSSSSSRLNGCSRSSCQLLYAQPLLLQQQYCDGAHVVLRGDFPVIAACACLSLFYGLQSHMCDHFGLPAVVLWGDVLALKFCMWCALVNTFARLLLLLLLHVSC